MMSASLLLLLSAVLITSGTVISNISPRRDTDGNILNAHDGNIILIDGEYHWYSVGFDDCVENDGCSKISVRESCGFMSNHSVTLYTSKDLSSGSWVNRGNVLPVDNRPSGTMLGASVVYNKLTDLYVLWADYFPEQDIRLSRFLVATSKSRFGPFMVVNAEANLTRFDTQSGKVFVDDDGQGYITYVSTPSMEHTVSIERLTPDFIYSQGDSLPLNPTGCLGGVPTIFIDRESGRYFALATGCYCCFCSGGTSVFVYAADSILGHYYQVAAINSYLGAPAQQTYVLPLNTTTGWEYVWIGNHWGSAPDHLKSHDFTYWSLLNWTGAGASRVPQMMKFTDQFVIDLE